MLRENSPGGPRDGSTSPALLRDLKSSLAPAWQSLVQHYSPLIYGECRTQGLRPQAAADVTQDVFQCVFTLLPRFGQRRRTGSFRRWLRLITRNKIREHLRHEQRQPAGTGGTAAYQQLADVCTMSESKPIREALSSDPAAAVRLALRIIRRDFEPQTWQAFWRTAVDGCDATEIAAELATTPAAVRKAKSRVLARLREEMQSITVQDPPS